MGEDEFVHNTGQKLALNIDAHIAVDAGAGTGKTHTIIDRVMEHYLTEDQRATRILPKPDRPKQIPSGAILAPKSERTTLTEWGGMLPGEVVILTFTRKAAEEMRNRLRDTISSHLPGPTRKNTPIDTRVPDAGFPEQLLMLLEDAPIGTIDSFFNQLIGPYRGMLGDSLGNDVVSEAERLRIIEQSINTLWRLSTGSNKLGDAVDAGIRAEDAEAVLQARDRIARHFAGRRRATKMLSALIGSSIFVGEANRGLLDSSGSVAPELLEQRIFEALNEDEVGLVYDCFRTNLVEFVDLIRSHGLFDTTRGWPPDSRISALANVCDEPSAEDTWRRLEWLGIALQCVVSSKLWKSDPTIMYNKLLPNNPTWPSGMLSYSTMAAGPVKDNVKDRFIEIEKALRGIISTPIGQRVLHFTQLSMILNPIFPFSATRESVQTPEHLPTPLPERLPAGTVVWKTAFSLDSSADLLDDLRVLLRGIEGIILQQKERAEVHEFDDITRLTGDLLLANCPEICRTFYHRTIIRALDSMIEATGDEYAPWRDDNIHRAFAALERLEADPNLAGESASNLGEIRADLERRYDLLKKIRRRYRAFIIDEAQDNSPLQWRMLARLWGPREMREGEGEIPDTEWQPTVCYVGDMKQSIYAFRQAEVGAFRQHTELLRRINSQEFENLSQLHKPTPLRREDASRDARQSHKLKVTRATQLKVQKARENTPWVPFDRTDEKDDVESVHPDVVEARREGLITLDINYRTSGGLLSVMNHWWSDLFSERHHFFAHADYYASPQELKPRKEHKQVAGNLEWICPVMDGGSGDPPTDPATPIDPFSAGKPDSFERQAMMIARRVLSLNRGEATRVLSAEGEWREIPGQEPVAFGEIMILMASRGRLRDTIMRHLQALGIPAQADREGGLMSRPAVAELEGLVQFIARPHYRFAATWVARSSLIGMSDAEVQSYIGGAAKNEDLLARLLSHATSERQRNLVKRWIDLRNAGRLLDLLDETIDQSDLLVAHHDSVSIQDIEQFIDEVTRISTQAGGDAIVIADRLRELRNQSDRALEAQTIPDTDAVRVMSIHMSKGLEAKVVILADLFSGKQVKMTKESQNRLIVTPELFSGHPMPWSVKETPRLATWHHAKRLHQGRKNAEARRLLYVAATRVEQHLIIVGSPKNTTWTESGLSLPWGYSQSELQLGQMWAESLRQGSWERSESDSPWLQEGDSASTTRPISQRGEPRTLKPSSLQSNAYLGGDVLNSISIYHHPDCIELADDDTPTTPLIEQTRMTSQALDEPRKHEPKTIRKDTTARLRLAPHRLSNIDRCPRRHWFETRGGLRPDPISQRAQVLELEWDEREEESTKGLPDPTLLGLIVHRILEIGIGNPGPEGDEPSAPLPEVWSTSSPSLMLDESVISAVFSELLPMDVDEDATLAVVTTMLRRIESGIVGRLTAGEMIDGERVEGLRTEYPFTISNPISFESVPQTRWTPDGLETLAQIDSGRVDMDGSIDLALCSIGRDGPSIRPIDLKTEQAASILRGKGPLLASLGQDSSESTSEAEHEMLRHHRLQLALYHRALEMMESTRPDGQRRRVDRPGILIGVTGRLVIYPKEMFESAQAELDEILRTAARIDLATELPLDEFQRRPASEAHICKTCPFSKGALPICGPIEEA